MCSGYPKNRLQLANVKRNRPKTTTKSNGGKLEEKGKRQCANGLACEVRRLPISNHGAQLRSKC